VPLLLIEGLVPTPLRRTCSCQTIAIRLTFRPSVVLRPSRGVIANLSSNSDTQLGFLSLPSSDLLRHFLASSIRGSFTGPSEPGWCWDHWRNLPCHFSLTRRSGKGTVPTQRRSMVISQKHFFQPSVIHW